MPKLPEPPRGLALLACLFAAKIAHAAPLRDMVAVPDDPWYGLQQLLLPSSALGTALATALLAGAVSLRLAPGRLQRIELYAVWLSHALRESAG